MSNKYQKSINNGINFIAYINTDRGFIKVEMNKNCIPCLLTGYILIAIETMTNVILDTS